MIPQSFIQELLGRVDIVEVVDRHVKLKRAGANYVACCPFHSEKTPSFTVSPTKQFYHCFGCGAHGTAVGFLMEYAGMGFVEAVKELAAGVGLKVPEVRSERAERRAAESESLTEVLLRAARYYREELKKAPHAIAYLKGRGLSGEIAGRFGIGYAPEGWQNLAAAFSDYEGPALAAAGLTKTSEEGRRYDLFRNRIMFPIVDVRGNVIGFGGRVLGEGEPKYLNSPETAVFEKGRELYGLYQARRAIRDAGRVVVVEGYMDVVALAQHGVEYAVATLGTATTGQHVQKLLRQAEEVVFCFDGDEAGRRAAWRALEASLPQLPDGKQVKFLFLPQGEDPDTYVRGHGRAGFEALLARAVPLSRFLLEELAARVDLATAEGRAGCVHAAKPLLGQMQPNALRLQLVREIAQQCRMAPEEVAQLCELRGAARRPPVPAYPARAAPAPLARTLLRLLVAHPKLAAGLTEQQRKLLEGPEMEPVLGVIALARASAAVNSAMLLEAARGSPHERAIEQACVEALAHAYEEETARADLEGTLAKLEQERVNNELAPLIASGMRNERYYELMRRLAELKGVAADGARPRP
ncbi:MAG TPA: DNA primase [Burkholderiales bacterium]|nr:DNA primase [Burkholderiales bacterium]